MVAFVARVFLDSLLTIAFISPLVLIALWRTPPPRRARMVPLLVISVLVVIDTASLYAPHFGFFTNLAWNWQGKILQTLWPVIFILLTPGISFSEMGFNSRIVQRAWPSILTVSLVPILLPVLGLILGSRVPTDIETLLFELTMPGIAEEAVFRGVFQSLLNRVFERRWSIWQAQVGWGFVLTAVLFALVHMVNVSNDLQIHLNPGQVVSPLIVGFILGWIRERSGSIWPGIIVHNLTNSIGVAGSWIVTAVG